MRTVLRKAYLPLFLSLLSVFCLATPAHAEEEIDALLDRVREAVGHENLRAWERGIMVKGIGEAMDLPSRFCLFYLSDGRFRTDVMAEVSFTEGFDGTRGWTTDITDMPGHLEHTGLEAKKISAWILGGHWLDSSCPLEFEEMEDGLLLRLPEGKISVELQIDPATALPREITWHPRREASRVVLEDYREVQGPAGAFRFPHKIVTTEAGMVVSIEVERVLKAPGHVGKLCCPVTRRPADTKFDRNKPPDVELEYAPDSHLLVHPLLDGRDMGWFLLDTGCGMDVIHTATADALGMAKIGKLKGAGVGGMADVRFRKGKILALGPVEIEKPIFAGLDLSFLSLSYGRKIGGLLGHGFLSRVLVELDMKNKELRLYEPGTWDERREDWQEIVFHNNGPGIVGELPGGRKGIFYLDSGAPGTVAFSQYYIAKEELFGDGPVNRSMTGGVGGNVLAYNGMIPWFAFGGHRFEDLGVTLVKADDGVMAERAVAGLIGNDLMGRFKLLWDVPGKRIAFLDSAAE